MNNHERVCDAITKYIHDNPEELHRVFSRDEVIKIYQNYYPNLKGSDVSPSDICWNRVNGKRITKDFQNWAHSLEYVVDVQYRLLGSDCNYSGIVYYRPKGYTEDMVFGVFENGKFTKVVSQRIVNLKRMLENALKNTDIKVKTEDNDIQLLRKEKICRILVEEEYYSIFPEDARWCSVSTFVYDKDMNYSNVDMPDECVGEVIRMIAWEKEK